MNFSKISNDIIEMCFSNSIRMGLLYVAKKIFYNKENFSLKPIILNKSPHFYAELDDFMKNGRHKTDPTRFPILRTQKR